MKKKRSSQYSRPLRNQTKNFLYEVHFIGSKKQGLKTKKILYGSHYKLENKEILNLARQNLAMYYGIHNASIRIFKKYRLPKSRMTI